jgi:hypothetical protein
MDVKWQGGKKEGIESTSTKEKGNAITRVKQPGN